MTTFKLVNIVAQYISYVYVIGISFALSIFIARALGPAEFGIYVTALSAGSILGILFDLGFKHIIQREMAQPSKKLAPLQPQLLATAIGVSLLISTITSIILCMIFPGWKILILSVSACFLSIAFTQFISAYMKGSRQFIRESIHLAGARTASAFAILALLILGNATSLTILIAWGGGLLTWNFLFNRFAFAKLNISSAPSFFPMLLSLFIIDLSITVYFRADILLLQFFGSDQVSIGHFSAALRLVEGLILMGLPLRSMLQTKIRSEQLISDLDVKVFTQRLIVVGIVGASLGFIINLIADPLVLLIYGEDFSQASSYLKILAWILIPAYMLAVISEMMIAREAEVLYKYLALAMALLMVITTFFVQMNYGILRVAQLKVLMEAIFAVAGFGLICMFLLRKKAFH